MAQCSQSPLLREVTTTAGPLAWLLQCFSVQPHLLDAVWRPRLADPGSSKDPAVSTLTSVKGLQIAALTSCHHLHREGAPCPAEQAQPCQHWAGSSEKSLPIPRASYNP